MLTDNKITNDDIASKGVVSAPDKLSGTAAENKAVFDRLIREVIENDFNNLIDALAGASGASEIGFAELPGLDEHNVQDAIVQVKAVADSKADGAATEGALSLKADAVVTSQHIKGVAFDSVSGIFTFTKENGNVISFDTAMEKVATNWEYVNTVEHPQSLKLTLADGSVQYISLSAFITETEFADSTEIEFGVSDGKVTAHIKAGSINDTLLASSFIAQLQNYVSQAAASATNAHASEEEALVHKNSASTACTQAQEAKVAAQNAATSAHGSAVQAGESKEHASTSAADASAMAILAGKYAVGPTKLEDEDYGTPTDSNNARYYMEKAAEYASSEGRMLKPDYDYDNSVLNAGGIKNFVKSLHLDEILLGTSDANTMFPSENHKTVVYCAGDTGTINLPTANAGETYFVAAYNWEGNWACQTAFSFTTNHIHRRLRNGSGAFTPWQTVAFASDFLPLSGGTITGTLKMQGSHMIQARHINGSSDIDNSLYLNFGSNAPVRFGNTGVYYISADGAWYSGIAVRAALSQAVAPTSYEARATALFPTEATPTIEGAIAWQYE